MTDAQESRGQHSMMKSELSRGQSPSGLLGLWKDFGFDRLGRKSSSRERRADLRYRQDRSGCGV